ncbi:MAG: hypothetical protein JWP01_3251 [Myxococcales bacterium]|nr:hypothetical protein [Myxococcales bacterium]
MTPALIAWGLYLFLTPIYVFKSGLPQPGDVFILVLVPIALRGWNGKLSKGSLRAARSLLWFTLWVCLVDYGWATALGNFGLFGTDTFILFPVYYIYNSLMFLVSLVLYERYGERFLRLTLSMIYISLAMQVVASFGGQVGSRGALFFNNPNQLGYYALLIACLIVMLHWRLKLRLLASSIALMSCAYLAMVSASRASIAGIAVLLAILVFSNPRVVVAVSAVAFALLFAGGPITEAFERSHDRVLNRTHHLGFLEERGYDRIVEHKEYLLFGAGEGGLSRFADSPYQQMEIHGSAGTVLFSYGVVGVLLFLTFLWQLVRGASMKLLGVLIPPLVYTVAHQGLRFTILWVMFAIFLCMKAEMPRRGRPKPAPVRGLRRSIQP